MLVVFVVRSLLTLYERDDRQGAAKVDEARGWMKENAAAHANSKQIDQTNKQLHTNLRREMERAKQVSLVSPTHLQGAAFDGLTTRVEKSPFVWIRVRERRSSALDAPAENGRKFMFAWALGAIDAKPR